MDLTTILFYVLAAITGGCAILVVVAQNIVRAAVWLLVALGGSAGQGEALLGIDEATPKARLTGVPDGTTLERKRVSYLLPFEIVSVHLLVVLIGAAYLARAKRRKGATP